MPRRLLRLELHGYKTFAGRTEFEFGNITCIIGPNGSGKSNIADSLRWVLGEQSFSLLRGRKTEDMIFNGSALRPRSSMASANVIFDNADQWLPIEFSEVSLQRRAYRDGQNEYVLNSHKTRLRDITELLGKVGLAQRTYTVVGQGLVDTALSLKAEQRRALFEEAAGIGVYKQKREDALRKLEQTAHNTERLQDILAEIRPRLRALERQAQRASELEAVTTAFRASLRSWHGFHWQAAQATTAAAQLRAAAAAKIVGERRNTQTARDSDLSALRAAIGAQRAQINSWHREAAHQHSEVEQHMLQLAVSEERTRNIAQQVQALQTELIGLDAALAAQTGTLQAAETALQALAAQRTTAAQRLEALRTAQGERGAQRSTLEQQLEAVRQQANNTSREQAGSAAEQRNRSERWNVLRGEIEARQLELQSISTQSAEQEQAASADSNALQAAAATRNAAEAAADAAEQSVQAAEQQLAALRAQGAELVSRRERLLARSEVLRQETAPADELASGRARLRHAAASGALPAYLTDLIDVLQVPAEYDTAITAALSSALHAAIVADAPAVQQSAQLLQNAGGRATLLPLQALRPPAPLELPAADGTIDWAARVVTCDPRYRPAVDLLLGRVLLCRDAASAAAASLRLPSGAAAVATSGELYTADGMVVVGIAQSGAALALAREARELPERTATATQDLALCTQQTAQQAAALEEAQQSAVAARSARSAAQQAEQRVQQAVAERSPTRERILAAQQLVRTQLAALTEEQARLTRASSAGELQLEQLAATLAAAEHSARVFAAQLLEFDSEDPAQLLNTQLTELAVVERAQQDATARHNELQSDLQRVQAERNTRALLGQQLAADHTEVAGQQAALRTSMAAGQQAVNTLQSLIDPAEAQLADAERQLGEMETSESKTRAGLAAAERENADAQLELQRRQNDTAALQERVRADFSLLDFAQSDQEPGVGLSFEELAVELEAVDVLPDGIEDALNRQRSQVRRLGGISPDVLREYTEVRDRHTELQEQVADLSHAASQLRELVAELDVLMEQDFNKTFERVAAEFQLTFKRLFNGGSARLELTQPNDIANTGVEIMAQLPGRRQQGLALLSGGERSLTACALVFSLLRVSPTPFALLDEVDAMLDDSNVERFRELVEELSQTTQFVIITHNRRTVEVADTVYGITMGTDSASQIISLKLEGKAKP
jgi:chromosome segregation protein